MKALRTGLGPITATMAILVLPAVAQGAYLVPPENSAAAQYTEAYPTAGGNQEAGKGKGGNRSPAAVLGAKNTQRLHAQGQAGREAAEVAATTAPSVSATSEPVTAPTEQAPHATPSHDGKPDSAQPATPVQTAHGGNETTSAPQDQPSGSSGLGEVIAEATGSSSSGEMGLLLPLVILGTVAWSLAFLWRQRKKPTS